MITKFKIFESFIDHDIIIDDDIEVGDWVYVTNEKTENDEVLRIMNEYGHIGVVVDKRTYEFGYNFEVSFGPDEKNELVVFAFSEVLDYDKSRENLEARVEGDKFNL